MRLSLKYRVFRNDTNIWSAFDQCCRSDQNVVFSRSWCDPCWWLGAWSGIWPCGGACSSHCHFSRHGGAVLGVVGALSVTLLYKHELSHCILWTRSWLIFASGVSPRTSREFPASISLMLANFYLSGGYQSMSETQSQRINVRDSMSETQCQSQIN